MEAMIVRNVDISIVSLPTISVGHSKRHTTNKYWSVLFLVAIYIWIVAGPQVVRVKSNGKINSNYSTIENTTSKCVQPKIKRDFATITKATYLYVSHVWDKHWLVNVFTCNPAFLDENYSRSGSIVILAHVLFCVCLLIYSFTSMRTDEIYRKQFYLSIMTLLSVTMLTQEIFMIKYTQDTNTIPFQILLFNIILWFIPEVILAIIGCTINPSSKRDDSKRYDDDDENNEDDDDTNDDDGERTSVNLSTFLGAPSILIFVLLYILSLMTIVIILDRDFQFKYKLIWSNEWSANGIVIVATCYVILIIYYFLLMTMSCLTSISYEKRNTGQFKDFGRAMFIVARYHFGTLCYHATLIFPRLHATFIMNEKEFRENPKCSTVYRLYLTHWKIPNLSSTLIAACGYSHSKSIRESLRLFNNDSLKSKKIQSFSRTHKCCSALLMMIYSLIIISLWTHGVRISPGFITATWLAYLLGIYITSIIMRFYDAAADVLWYLDDGTVVIEY